MNVNFSELFPYGNVDNFVKFYNIFLSAAESFNLTSVTEENEVYVKHFYDSLQGLPFLKNHDRIVEIGSGGGFPSFPLKIADTNLDFTLIEATEKKCRYLESAAKEMGFKNFEVINGRCEELSRRGEFWEVFDAAVARAVAPMNILTEYLLPFLKVGGVALCYKGGNYREELIAAESAIKELSGRVKEVFEYKLPYDMGSRAIVIIEKIAPCKDTYPRREAKIRKSPL